MEFTITQPKKAALFAALFQHIKTLTEHINIYFEEERMYMQAMDSSQISILEIVVPRLWFDTYKLTSEETTRIGVRAATLFTVLSVRAANQQIKVLYKNDEHSDKLFVYFTGDEGGVFDRFIEMPLMELDADMLGIPEMDYQVDVSLPSKEFATIIHQMKEFGETIEFQCTEESVCARGKSIERGVLNANIPISALSGYAIGENVKQCFSLKYLHTICLYEKIARDVDIHFSDNSPMKVHYTIPAITAAAAAVTSSEDEVPTAHIYFYLAPKMDDDE
jgi:proliferating cell nuclear antigen PCNA